MMLTGGCKRSSAPDCVVVHVLRDPAASFVPDLRRADLNFNATTHFTRTGKRIVIGTLEGGYSGVLQRLSKSPWDLVIFDSAAKTPDGLRNQLGPETQVCGHHPAFVPNTTVGEQRDATEMYLRFIAAECK